MALFGQHTANELQDLITAGQYKVDQTEKAIPGANVDSDWMNDWGNFLLRWNPAVVQAKAHISSSLVPLSLAPSENLYQALLVAMQKTPGTLQKGDLDDLMNRLRKAGAKIDESKTPQPQATDIDHGIYLAADTTIKDVIKPIEDAPKNLTKLGWDVLVDRMKEHPVISVAILGGLGYFAYTKVKALL